MCLVSVCVSAGVTYIHNITYTHAHTATTVSELNITATQLASLLIPLQEQASSLATKLTHIQGEVMGKREERERKMAKEMADTQTTMIRLKRELDVSQDGRWEDV